MTSNVAKNRSGMAESAWRGPAALAAGALLALPAAGALAAAQGVTRETVLVEEFTAEWCGPCVGGAAAMGRLKDRWGDEVSILALSVSDIYTNPDGTKRNNECGVWAIPTFEIQGTYQHVGTPSDATFDSNIRSAQDQARDGRIVGHWKLRPNDIARVSLKFEADVAIPDEQYEIRVVIHETPWHVNCSNGLDGYDYHMQQVFYQTLPALDVGEQWAMSYDYDLSANRWIHDINNIGVTVYLHDKRTGRSVEGSWELGAVNLGDLNGDLDITRKDAQLFRAQRGKTDSDPDFNPAADWDQNGVINRADKDLFMAYVENGGMR